MPTTIRTVFLTDENGNPLIDEQRNMRTLSFSLMQGYSYRLVERASIVSATYAQVVGYSTATGQTIAGVENASEFDVGDFGIVQYAISDRNNTIGYVTCKVTAVGTDSLTVNGIGISVAGADGKDGAPGADGKDGAATVQIGTVTTGAAGSQASVTNVGADNAAILNFTIPRGDTGAQGVPGPSGADGKDGTPGAAATVSVGQVATLPAGSQATVTNVGDETAAVFNFGIPSGAQGEAGRDGINGTDGKDGVAATIQVGTVTTGAAGSEAVVTNAGTENAAILDFTIPRGAQGERGIQGEPGAPGKDGADGQDGAAATVTVGQVTTLPAGSQATVTNSGTETAAVLNFAIPQGAQGAAGADGANGTNGADGEDGVGIATIVAAGTDDSGGNIYRIELTDGRSYTFVAPKGATGNTGATGATGAPGKDFRIYRTYASIAAMNADASNVPDGEFVMIASSENDPDNAKLYVRATGGEVAFTFISDLSGAQGIQGEAATVTIGQVLTGEPGTNASVENAGTEHEAILNFTIPRGATGAAGRDGTNGKDGKDGINGQDGADGVAATIQIGEVITGAPGTNASVENTGTENAAILKITIPRGNAGVQGEQGEPGQKGADGKDGADGAPGTAATIQIGTVTTGAAGSQAAVTNTGTANAAILNFTIPRGNTGAQGNPGNDGAPGADGASGVTDVTAGTPTEQNGYTVTPVTFNFEQGNSKTVNIQAKNGEGAGVQQNAIINRTTSIDTADENSPDFVIKEGNLYVKAEGKLGTYTFTYTNNGGVEQGSRKGAAATTSAVYIFGNWWTSGNRSKYIYKYDPETNRVSRLSTTIPTTLADMGIASIGDVIYLFGGSTGTGNVEGGDATNTIYKFDAQTETITALTTTLPTSCWGCSAAYSPSNNKIYVFGGNTPIDPLNTILEFDPTTETINSVGTFDLSYSDGGIFHAPAVTIGTKIYLFAGQGKGYTRYSSVWIFDTVSKTTPQRINSILPRVFEYSFGAATLNNGLVYLFNKEEDANTPVYVFNPSTQQVYSTSTLCPLENPTACTYKESIIVVGNRDYAPDYNMRIFAEEEGLRYFRIPVQDSLGVISAGGFNATT